MDKKSPDVRYICRISGWDFKHLAVRGWFRHADSTLKSWTKDEFQSPRGEGVVQTIYNRYFMEWAREFQSPRGEGVVQTTVRLIRKLSK